MNISYSARRCLCVLLGVTIALSGAALAAPATESVIEAGRLDALGAALEQHGWRVERDADGSLVLFPPGEKSVPESTPAPAPGPETSAPTSGAPDTTVPAGDLDGLGRALSARGWRTELDATGDLLVFPIGPRPPDEAASEAADAVPKATVVDATDLDTLQAVAAQGGWGHRRESDGTLVLIPPGHAPAADSGAACQSGMSRVAAVADLALPVDSWQKARRLAQGWIDQSAANAYAIGKIRQVNELYLVSLLDRETPHRLRVQLVIRTADGCVLAVTR
ncbi:MAG: hypothetical protein ACFCUJ_15085 [Thiotrichales bacterium]